MVALDTQFRCLERLVEPCKFATASDLSERKSWKLGSEEEALNISIDPRGGRKVGAIRHLRCARSGGEGLLSCGRRGTTDAGRSVIPPPPPLLLERAHVPRKPTNLTPSVRVCSDSAHTTRSSTQHEKYPSCTDIMQKSVIDNNVFVIQSQCTIYTYDADVGTTDNPN
jgi:hypothetical protein